MSASSVTISDMQHFVSGIDEPDIQISSNIGNVIELGGEDLGDDFGAGLLSNHRVGARPAPQGHGGASSQGGGIAEISSLDPIGDIGIQGDSLDPLEPISLDVPSSSSPKGAAPLFPEISVSRDSSSAPDLFFNSQTATGPSIPLSAVSRLSPEEERKRKEEEEKRKAEAEAAAAGGD